MIGHKTAGPWSYYGGIPFTGVFDGNDHTISNFTYTSADAGAIGLFQFADGQIKNVGLIDPNIDAGMGEQVGALAAGIYDGCRITGCYVKGGGVSGGRNVGGLVGLSSGEIIDCNVISQVIGIESVGGLVGFSSGGMVTDCHSSGSVMGFDDVGGLVGVNLEICNCWWWCTCWGGRISGCYSTCGVQGEHQVGGLVGKNISAWAAAGSGYGAALATTAESMEPPSEADIINCYAHGDVIGTNHVGGLVGLNDSLAIASCYSSGAVTGVNDVGGLVGTNGYSELYDSNGDNLISNSYSTGSALGDFCVGGLVGANHGTIDTCYSTGPVDANYTVGGLVGWSPVYCSESGCWQGLISNSFWDIDTSKLSYGAGGEGKTTASMKAQSTFDNLNWDFVGELANGTDDIWAICEGQDYPRLTWEFNIGDFDGDADTDFADFCIMADRWFSVDGSFWCGEGCDLTNDAFIDFSDLLMLAENWLGGVVP